PDWVERFSAENGLLVWYVNYAYGDNNTSAHPGYGNVLPVDARPAPVVGKDGKNWITNRRQSWDATFGLERTKAVTFHKNGVPVEVPASNGIRTFDDSNKDQYWSADNPWNSCKVAGEGVKITVLSSNKSGMTVRISP
ncbi:MAG: immune inhibitor A domain-containing protein, partial [Micromonosporaceae bacterium]